MVFDIPESDEHIEPPCAPEPQGVRNARRSPRWLASIQGRIAGWLNALQVRRRRKALLGTTAVLLGIGVVMVLRGAATTPVLKIYVWRGYADAAVIAPYEAQCHCYVSVRYMDTSDDLYRALAEGQEYDVISASSDIAGDLVQAGLVRPLETSIRQLDLKDPLTHPAVTDRRGTYGVPFMWGPNVLIYSKEVFPEPPNSWKILFEQQYRGRVAVWDDLSTLYMAGLSQNSQADIYNLNDAKTACQWLQQLPANDTKLWEDEPDLVKMFRSGKVVAAMGWPLATRDLKSIGMAVDETIPKEGTTGWVDYLMIPSTSKHTNLAYELIKHLSSRNAQEYVARITHTYPANRMASNRLTKEELKTWLNGETIRFWQPLGQARRATYNRAWESWKQNSCKTLQDGNISITQR